MKFSVTEYLCEMLLLGLWTIYKEVDIIREKGIEILDRYYGRNLSVYECCLPFYT